jgi:hypothetical protein
MTELGSFEKKNCSSVRMAPGSSSRCLRKLGPDPKIF